MSHRAARVMVAIPGETLEVTSRVPGALAALSLLYRPARRRPIRTTRVAIDLEEGEVVVRREGAVVWRAGDLVLGLVGLYCHIFDAVVHRRDRHVLHAGAVAFGDRAVLVLGESESGKSSLTALLVARGGALLSDDVVPVSFRDARCEPYSRRMLIRAESLRRTPAIRDALEVVGELETGRERLLIADASRRCPPRPAPRPAVLLFSSWTADGPPFVARRLGTGEAAARVMDHSLNLRYAGHPVVRSAVRLAREVPAYEIAVRDPIAAAAWAHDLALGRLDHAA